MRSTLLCVFFTIIVQRGGSQSAKDDDFKPTPIPLDEWHHENGGNLAGTLQETINDSSAVVAAVPAHYWEDALRHSVYLTLVRDKIDQLISKGTIVSIDPKSDHHVSEEVDDRDLWQKIKTAPFDRLKDEEPAAFGDVTIMAKGRLLEEKEGYRFTEDEPSKEKCNDDKCMEGVKAFWSVKRVRQRDVETSPGKYHYELTFSVTSKTSAKKQRKPYETPIRTFTVRENSSHAEQHLEARINELKQSRLQRPQRAIWFHKNIVPTQHYQARNYNQGLDRIFSSLFTNEDSFDDAPRYKQNTYVPQVFPQYSKVGHVGAPSEQHHQKKLMPYPYKPQTFKYSRPPLQAPPVPQHHYIDFDPMINNHYTPAYMDQRYISSNTIKTTRPAVLPTPPVSTSQIRNITTEKTNVNLLNITDYTTKNPEILTPPTHKTYIKTKPAPMKISYFPDHVRPPVFNAPPGVFVTMDKKPFKPMPPLKLVHSTKPLRNKPTDFRPSPQVLDIQFSDPDPLQDSAFRPITVKYSDINITEPSFTDHNKNKISRKKPAKKHENVKSHRVTTTPFTIDIITAGSESIEDKDTMEWANILGAFTRTTPMASQSERANTTESVVSVTSVTVPITATAPSTTTIPSITKAGEVTTTKSTTSRPKKRTRPPPKFTKPDKIKKHKRVTTTSTTTTKAPEVIQTKKPQQDLTPQATSAVTGGLKHKWEPKNKTISTTPLTTSTTTFTTSRPSTTTTVITTTIKDEDAYIATTQSKNKNRFRQSTLMHKGTSVNHDKWSTPNLDKTATKLAISPSGKLSTRRKGSNFHGYLQSTTPRYLDQERKKEYHEDHISSLYITNVSSTTDNIIENISEKSSPQPTFEDSIEPNDRDKERETEDDLIQNHYEFDDDSNENTEKNESFDNHEESNEQESKDHNEYIFQNTSTAPSEKTNEIIEVEKLSPTVASVISSHPVFRNKTKCKKKKNHNLTTTEETPKASNEFKNEIVTELNITSTTESAATPDIFEELFGGFTMDETSEKPKESQLTTKSEPDEGESENHERYVHIDDDFEDFLDSLEKKENHSDLKNKSEEEYEDDKDFSADEEDSPFNYEDENEAARNTKDDIYDEYHDRPYSLLELMAME